MLHQVERPTSLAGLVIDPGTTLTAMQFEAKAAFRSPPPGSRLAIEGDPNRASASPSNPASSAPRNSSSRRPGRSCRDLRNCRGG